MAVDAKRLEAHEDLSHLVKLQRGIVGELLYPDAGLGATGQRYQPTGQDTDGALEAIRLLATLRKLPPQPLGLGHTLPQFTLQALLLLG